MCLFFFIAIDICVNMEGKLLEAILLNQSAAISRLNLGPILFECVSEQERERDRDRDEKLAELALCSLQTP